MFAGGEWRRRQVDDGAGAGSDELLDRIVVVKAPLPVVAIVPDVLADADAEASAAEVEHLRAVERLEVAILVEYVVGRQQRFTEPVIDASTAQQRRGVEQRPPFVRRVRFGEADEQRRPRGGVASGFVEYLPPS